MSLKVNKTALPGIIVFEPEVFGDRRGFFKEIYHKDKYEALGLKAAFVQDNHSLSTKGTIRGLHYQLNFPQGKLVFAISGEVFDVAVDIRYGSPEFGRWIGETLSENNSRQIYIPPGFAHGFCVLSETAEVIYKCTDLYHPEDDMGVNFSDSRIGIEWPVENRVLSDKDASLPMLHSIPQNLLPVY